MAGSKLNSACIRGAMFAACGLLYLVHVDRAIAQEHRVPHPERVAACVGFNDLNQGERWGFTAVTRCPKNSVVFDVNRPPMPRGTSARYIKFQANCCPLPKADILTDVEVFAAEECPEDHVVTSPTSMEPCEQCERVMRCTKINTERYRLGEKTEGVYWGFGQAYWKQRTQLMWGDVPAAIRYAVGRISKFHWEQQGCLGFPFGSLLVGKHSKRCHGLSFRQLQYQGLPGDPPRGTPVTMFPDCRGISDPFDPEARCIK